MAAANSSNGPEKAKLFFGKEFRPHRTPCQRQPAEVLGLGFVAVGVNGRLNPGLSAADEKMRRRHHPRRIVERAGANIDDFGTLGALAVDPPVPEARIAIGVDPALIP